MKIKLGTLAKYIKGLDGGKKLLFATLALLAALFPIEVVLSSQSSITATNSHEVKLGKIYVPYTEGAEYVEQSATALASLLYSVEQTADTSSTPNEATVDGNEIQGSVLQTDEAALMYSLSNASDIVSALPDSISPRNASADEVAVAGNNEADELYGDAVQQRSGDASQPSEFVNGVQKQLNAISTLVSGNDTTSDKNEAEAQQQTEATPTPKTTQTPVPSATQTPVASVEPANVPSQIITYEIDHEEQDIDDDSSKVLDVVAIPPAPTPAPEDPAANQIEAMIAVALEQVGKPYSRGGKGPDKFDCSGFVYYALNQSGYSIDYMTSASWAKSDFTTINSIDEMKRGDIICLRGHVGIYLGDGIMVDASSSNHKIVVRDVGGWCRRNFINAKRVFVSDATVNKQEEPIVPLDTIEIN